MTWATPEFPPEPEEPEPEAEPSPEAAPADAPPPNLAAAYPPLGEDEPWPDAPEPLEDTSPVAVPDWPPGLPMWRQAVGLALLLAAAALTFVAGVIVFLPLLTGQPALDAPPAAEQQPPPTATITAAPVVEAGGPPQPTLSPAQAAALLSQPLTDFSGSGGPLRRQDSPFTIVPERPRGEVITYTVQEGDTITAIAERFGLEMDTIAWSNERSVVFSLRPGAEMFILPVDGVYHRVLVPETIQSIADKYNVDPYVIINSEYNDLFGSTPETTLPSGMYVVVPGGTSTANDWQYNPVVERIGGGGSSGAGFISFAPGEPGSCGRQENPGGTGYFGNPLSSYTWVRGFTVYHTGVDLAAAQGTPVLAASPGRVIYAGWNNWGYGYLIVLAHGSFTTLYGHLYGINVGCGQMVSAGQVIGSVGSTGDSSGPHLHFEIRYNDIPTDPTLYVAF